MKVHPGQHFFFNIDLRLSDAHRSIGTLDKIMLHSLDQSRFDAEAIFVPQPTLHPAKANYCEATQAYIEPSNKVSYLAVDRP